MKATSIGGFESWLYISELQKEVVTPQAKSKLFEV